MKKILIIQPYVPGYRRQFFLLLRDACLEFGSELTIFAPNPDLEFSLRKDSASALPFIQEVGIARLKFFNRQLDFYKYPKNLKLSDFDLVIMEQNLKNLQYPLILLRSLPNTKIALWGHGKTIVKKKSRIEHWLQVALTKRADFFFAYTEKGRDYLINKGYSRSKVIAVRNSNSSIERLKFIKNAEQARSAFPKMENFHCCFIGALESSKGLDVLFEALPIIKAALPSFRFTFIGDGPDSDEVASFALKLNYVTWLGLKNQNEIDQISNQFSLILNPGRVGLIAVDSLMLLLPIVTMRESYHAPEYDYINENLASVSVTGSATDYADSVIAILQNEKKMELMRNVCAKERESYTVENMVENFKEGILKVISPGSHND